MLSQGTVVVPLAATFAWFVVIVTASYSAKPETLHAGAATVVPALAALALAAGHPLLAYWIGFGAPFFFAFVSLIGSGMAGFKGVTALVNIFYILGPLIYWLLWQYSEWAALAFVAVAALYRAFGNRWLENTLTQTTKP